MSMRRHVLALAFMTSIIFASGARAQDAAAVDAAKKEGKLVWYTSTPVETGRKIVDLFLKQYGIKVEMVRSGGSAILRRCQQEMDAGRVAADRLATSDPGAAAL